MSVDGKKVRALSNCCATIRLVMQGVGVWCRFSRPTILIQTRAASYFYDAMGGQFEATDYAATGSGPLPYAAFFIMRTTGARSRCTKLSEDEAVSIALRALDTAAESDTSTGGVDRMVGFIHHQNCSREGITTFPETKSLPSSRKRLHDRRPYRWSRRVANRREYIEAQLASGSPITALGYRDGILFLTIGQTRQKFSRSTIGSDGAIGHPGDIERLRMAAIELASTEGFTRSAADVHCAVWCIIRLVP